MPLRSRSGPWRLILASLGLAVLGLRSAGAQTCTSPPSEARDLQLSASQLSWQAPLDDGGSATILYDVLRAASPAGFATAACLATGISVTTYLDISGVSPAYYLIRSRNGCGGSLGSDSAAAPRSGIACPQADGGVCLADGDCASGTCCSGVCRDTLTDPNNCGGCGNVCNLANASAGCSGGNCFVDYCFLGFADCDGAAVTGCECNGNICCSGACEPQHVNGLGQSFDDCAPLGTPGNAATYTLSLATAARAAWPFIGTDGASSGCSGATSVVYRQTATTCAVWSYTKGTAGYVRLNTTNNTCTCPTTSDPTWY